MENHFYYLLIAAIAPVLAGLGYIFVKDKYNREPFGMLVKAFLYGFFSIIPIFIVEGIFSSVGSSWIPETSVLLVSAWSAFVVAAFTEESFKLGFLKQLIWNSPEFDERFDGIVYGVFVSLGFACAENIGYVFSSFYAGGVFSAYQTSFMRAVFSIPCHFFCGVILGYYLSLAKFETVNSTDPNAQNSVINKGLFYAILFHGLYDFILMYMSNYSSSLGEEAENNPEALTVIGGAFILFLAFNFLFWKFGQKRIYHLANLLQPNSKDEQSAFITCSSCGSTYSSDLRVCPNCSQPTSKTLLAKNSSANRLSNQNLHNVNSFSADHSDNRPPKNPFES